MGYVIHKRLLHNVTFKEKPDPNEPAFKMAIPERDIVQSNRMQSLYIPRECISLQKLKHYCQHFIFGFSMLTSLDKPKPTTARKLFLQLWDYCF